MEASQSVPTRAIKMSTRERLLVLDFCCLLKSGIPSREETSSRQFFLRPRQDGGYFPWQTGN